MVDYDRVDGDPVDLDGLDKPLALHHRCLLRDLTTEMVVISGSMRAFLIVSAFVLRRRTSLTTESLNPG